jgi:hypothetical protein
VVCVLSGTVLLFSEGRCVGSVAAGRSLGAALTDPAIASEPQSVQAADECVVLELSISDVEAARREQLALHDAQVAQALPSYVKSPEEVERCKAFIARCAVFRECDEETLAKVLEAMREVRVSPRTLLFQQGEPPDCSYFIEYGTVVLFRASDGLTSSTSPPTSPRCIGTVADGGYFGEIGMYQDAGDRYASAESADECVFWVLEKSTFQKLLLGVLAERRARGEAFLSAVGAWADLGMYQRSIVADLLVRTVYQPGEVIVPRGVCERCIIIESGTATCAGEPCGPGSMLGAVGILDVAAGSYYHAMSEVVASSVVFAYVLEREALSPFAGILFGAARTA